jgi:ArsR family transcriptional regulator
MQDTTFSRGYRAVAARAADAGLMPLTASLAAGSPAGADLPARAQEAAQLLKALANPDRLILLCQLAEAECSVTELGARSGIAQPSLSQQLGVLRGEQLVATRREGKHVLYRVASPQALAVLQTLHALFCEPGPEAAAATRASAPALKRVKKGAA